MKEELTEIEIFEIEAKIGIFEVITIIKCVLIGTLIMFAYIFVSTIMGFFK